MQAFDASSMIYAWDNYPIEQFPALWDWLASQIGTGQLAMPSVAFEEVGNKTPECSAWLKDQGLTLLEVTNEILLDTMRIKGLLGIVEDKYHPKGVGENDLIIIATARAYGMELVTDEERQLVAPQAIGKCKIPFVCAMTEVSVRSLNFLEYIKRSATVFR